MKEQTNLEEIALIKPIMKIVRDEESDDKIEEIPDAKSLADQEKEELSKLHESYLEAEKQRLGEELTLVLKLKRGVTEKTKKMIFIELEELNKEEILNLDERYKILEKIKNIKSNETTKEERREIGLKLHEMTREKNKMLNKKYILLQQMKKLDPSLLTESQLKRLEAPMDILSAAFLDQLKEKNKN